MKAMKKHFLFMLPVASLLAAALLSSCSSSDDDVTINPNALDHAIADLGLPSGTLWATTNVGATSPEGYGDYFAWGETEPYYNGDSQSPLTLTWKTGKTAGYDWTSYTKFGTYDPSASYHYYGFTKYNVTNGPTILESADDAATANWGSAWRMPTLDEWKELVNNTDHEWATINGVNGQKFMKKTDRSVFIFLPAAGFRGGLGLNDQGSSGHYWSSELVEDNPDGAWDLRFVSGAVGADYGSGRCGGYSVRPVVAQ